jgi:uncharacterized membrane protein YfcA
VNRSKMQSPLSFLTGLLAGTVGSLVGMGGAFVAIPMLTGPVGLSQRLASGTSIVSVLATATGAILSFGYDYSLSKPVDAVASSLSSAANPKPESFRLPVNIGNIHVPTAIGVCLASSFTAILGAKFSKSLSKNL